MLTNIQIYKCTCTMLKRRVHMLKNWMTNEQPQLQKKIQKIKKIFKLILYSFSFLLLSFIRAFKAAVPSFRQVKQPLF